MKVHYLDHHLEKFVRSLEPQAIAKFLGLVRKLHEYGPHLGMPYSKQIKPRLYELRIRSMQEVRVFYTMHGGDIFLLHGFVKQTKRIPLKEMRVAQRKLSVLENR